METRDYKLEFEWLFWRISIRPISKYSPSRKLGYEGVNILFYNFLITKNV